MKFVGSISTITMKNCFKFGHGRVNILDSVVMPCAKILESLHSAPLEFSCTYSLLSLDLSRDKHDSCLLALIYLIYLLCSNMFTFHKHNELIPVYRDSSRSKPGGSVA